MRNAVRILGWLPLLGILVFVNGCLVEGTSDVVLTKTITVKFDEYRTSENFRSEVVCDQFNAELEKWLTQKKVDPDDVVGVFIPGGYYKVERITDKNQDWTITASVDVTRQDPPVDGPIELVPRTEQPLTDARHGDGTMAAMTAGGTALLEKAAYDYIKGDDPIVVLTMVNTDVEPDPSVDNPLEFRWRASVDFQLVLNVTAAQLEALMKEGLHDSQEEE